MKLSGNMFDKMENKQIPKSLDECLRPDPLLNNLWSWCQWLERFGKILFWVIIIFGTIYSVLTSFQEVEKGIYYTYTDTEFNFILFLTSLWRIAIYAALEYCSYHLIALLIGAFSSIVQNTKISTDLNLYKFVSENENKTCKNETDNQVVADSKSKTVSDVKIYKRPTRN